MKKPNKKVNKTIELHKTIEKLLYECQMFTETEQYPLLIDSLSRASKLINEIKIEFIKGNELKKSEDENIS